MASIKQYSLNKNLAWNAAGYGIILVAVLFFIFTIRPGHNWGGDFALYIAHAINISSGQPYSDTGFIYNPNDPFLSPRSYPPVFPLLLAPIYRIFGLNLYAMKIAGILTFAVFLMLFYRYVCNRLDSPVAQVLVVASLAFSPWFWEAKDHILPDFIFMLFLYTTIMLMDRISGAREARQPQYLTGVVVGLLVYLVYATRSLGLFIIPALVLHDIIRHRMISRMTLIISVVFALFYLAQNEFMSTDQSYFDSLRVIQNIEEVTGGAVHEQEDNRFVGEGVIAVIKNNIQVLGDRLPRKLYEYSQMMSGYWFIGDSVIPGRVLFSVMTILAVTGFLGFIIKAPSMGDYFILTYIMILLVVPFQQQRYMLPLVPLYLLYIFRGTEQIKQFATKQGACKYSRFLNALPVIVFMIIAASYVSSYSLSDPLAIERGVESMESKELFDFIRVNTPGDSLIIFHKPRPLALFTGRRAVKYHWELDLDKLWRELIGMGATHIILPKYIDATVHSNYFFPAIVDRYRRNLDILFENRDYIVYRIEDIPAVGSQNQ
jgi:hypothetical protein